MLIRFENLQALSLRGQFVTNPDFSPVETSSLWRGFRSRLKELNFSEDQTLWSVQLHNPEHPGKIAQRWAAAPAHLLSGEMEKLEIPGGLYAVFLYRGGMAGFESFLIDAFQQKLPSLSLALDKRPHFQLLGKNFNPFSEDSEEEVWIPVVGFEQNII